MAEESSIRRLFRGIGRGITTTRVFATNLLFVVIVLIVLAVLVSGGAKLAGPDKGALVIAPEAFYSVNIERIGALTVRHKLPTIFGFREFVAAGGLISYTGSYADSFRIVGKYAGRILKGEKPADLPVQQSTKIEMFINLKTAGLLGITVPPGLLVAADEVIE